MNAKQLEAARKLNSLRCLATQTTIENLERLLPSATGEFADVATQSLAHVRALQDILVRKDAVLAKKQVKELPADTPRSAVNKARLKSSVKVGNEVLLPLVSAELVAIPKDVLRSALFGCHNAGEDVKNYVIYTSNSRITLIFKGILFGDDEFAVFTAVLSLFRDLSLTEHVTVSYLELARRAGFGENSYSVKKVIIALENLADASIRVRTADGAKVDFPKLVRSGTSAKAPGRVVIKMDEDIASLFGENCWTSIHTSTVYLGAPLRSWLANYFESHSTTIWLSLQTLANLARWTRGIPEFRHKIQTELKMLMSPDTPAHQRIAGFHLSADSDFIWICRDQSVTAKHIRAATKDGEATVYQPKYERDNKTPFVLRKSRVKEAAPVTEAEAEVAETEDI